MQEVTGQSFAYEIRENSAVIRRCFSRDTRAEIPEYLEGYRVTEIAPYAFSAHLQEQELKEGIRTGAVRIHFAPLLEREDYEKLPVLSGNLLKEICLPPSVKRVGKYCFYNCGGLRRIEFHGGLSDWGSGVFTGCHHVEQLLVHTDEEERSYLKDVLDELREELEVLYFGSDSQPEAVLMFPEFYEEGVENTPARILETHVHGSGILYRNCFQNRKFDFRQYDTVFPHAVAQESPQLLARMTVGRLRHPHELSAAAEKAYRDYVEAHIRDIAGQMVRQRDMEGIRWLLESGRENDLSFLDDITDLASRYQFTECLSYLMEFWRSHTRIGRKRFEL